MKVGDLVQLSGTLVKFKGHRAPPLSKKIGVVVEAVDDSHLLPENYKGWAKFLGPTITVLWEDGTLSKPMAGNALKPVEEVLEHEIERMAMCLSDL